jgi:hypothetical protein
LVRRKTLGRGVSAGKVNFAMPARVEALSSVVMSRPAAVVPFIVEVSRAVAL